MDLSGLCGGALKRKREDITISKGQRRVRESPGAEAMGDRDVSNPENGVRDVNTSYNALLGRPSLNKLGAIVSTPYLAMKFPTDQGGIATIHADQRTARECYVASLKLTPTTTSATRDVSQRMVAMTDLNPRINDEVRMEPRDAVEE